MRFWDRLAVDIKTHKVKWLAGDFNMALFHVIPMHSRRGLSVDCVTSYPWRHETKETHRQYLGVDSMAIFYIGGCVSVDLYWNLQDIPWLTAVAEEDPGECGFYGQTKRVLHLYDGENCPGQPWGCYRWAGFKETLEHKRPFE